MKRITIALVAVAVGGALTIVGAPAASAEPDTRFGTCRAMRAVDPNGVARTERTARQAVREGFRAPLVCPVAYRANSHLDPDGDGVACERRR
jgi:hypothetical protein